MIDLYPAIDLLGGRVVRLRTGDYDDQTVYGDDPVAVARDFAAAGATWIHVVDLDAAKYGRPGQPAGRGGDRGRGGIDVQGCRRVAEYGRWTTSPNSPRWASLAS